MPHADDRWLKRVWLVNGIVLLPLLLFTGAVLLWTSAAGRSGGREGIAAAAPSPADSSRMRPRAVRLGAPEPLATSGFSLIPVRHGHGNLPAEGFGFSGSGVQMDDALVQRAGRIVGK